MEILPKQPSTKGPTEWFSGDVWIDPIARGDGLSRIRVSAVHFTPGSRTAWHSHALGQTLYVTEGEGMMQSRGDRGIRIRCGDIIYTAPDEEHWHGAAPDHFMTHLTMTEGVGDSPKPETLWLSPVTDGEYRGA
jgi:quercetin dioxygenase-like cupin family protein